MRLTMPFVQYEKVHQRLWEDFAEIQHKSRPNDAPWPNGAEESAIESHLCKSACR